MDADVSEPRALLRMAILAEGGLGLVAMILGWFMARPPWQQVAWTAPAVGYGLLAALPLLVALLLVTRYPVGPFKGLRDFVDQFLVPMFDGSTIGQMLLISIVAGIGEELLFRGFLQSWIEQISGLPWLALAIASIVFGLAHAMSVTYAVLAGAIGAYLGWLLMASDNLVVPMVTHAAYDFAALVYLTGRKETTLPDVGHAKP